MDHRLINLAHVIVDYSLQVKPGDWAVIVTTNAADALNKEIYRRVLERGGQPPLRSKAAWEEEVFFSTARDQQLDFVSPIMPLMVERADCWIVILAESNTKNLSRIDPAQQQRATLAQRDVIQTYRERASSNAMRYLATLFPTQAYAQDAEMSLEQYENFVYGAGLLDDADPIARWTEFGQRQLQKVAWLKGHDQVHIRGANIDLKLSIKDRSFISAHGIKNFPDGEVYTSPIEDSANGWVRFTYPLILYGREVEGVEFKIESGKVVKATAKKNEESLLSLLNTDAGANILGELGIGTSPNITQFTRNMLFDEKIKGTIHLAVGNSFTEVGGRNQSAVHADIICDLHDGEILVDNEVFYRNGDFVI
jgi:aminopeptidase